MRFRSARGAVRTQPWTRIGRDTDPLLNCHGELRSPLIRSDQIGSTSHRQRSLIPASTVGPGSGGTRFAVRARGFWSATPPAKIPMIVTAPSPPTADGTAESLCGWAQALTVADFVFSHSVASKVATVE